MTEISGQNHRRVTPSYVTSLLLRKLILYYIQARPNIEWPDQARLKFQKSSLAWRTAWWPARRLPGSRPGRQLWCRALLIFLLSHRYTVEKEKVEVRSYFYLLYI